LYLKHRKECCKYIEGDFKLLYGLNTKTRLYNFIFALNEIFCSLFEEKNKIFYAAVLYVGPAENAAKYKYKMVFLDKDGTESITIMHLTSRYDLYLNDIYKSGNCVKLLYDEVSHLNP
jgi:hypothetical protein